MRPVSFNTDKLNCVNAGSSCYVSSVLVACFAEFRGWDVFLESDAQGQTLRTLKQRVREVIDSLRDGRGAARDAIEAVRESLAAHTKNEYSKEFPPLGKGQEDAEEFLFYLRSSIQALPEHTIRVQPDMQAGTIAAKIRNRVEALTPAEYNRACFVVCVGRSTVNGKNLTPINLPLSINFESAKRLIRLRSPVCHVGEFTGQGHHFAYTTNPETGWTKWDDLASQGNEPAPAERCLGEAAQMPDGAKSTSYLAFYKLEEISFPKSVPVFPKPDTPQNIPKGLKNARGCRACNASAPTRLAPEGLIHGDKIASPSRYHAADAPHPIESSPCALSKRNSDDQLLDLVADSLQNMRIGPQNRFRESGHSRDSGCPIIDHSAYGANRVMYVEIGLFAGSHQTSENLCQTCLRVRICTCSCAHKQRRDGKHPRQTSFPWHLH